MNPGNLALESVKNLKELTKKKKKKPTRNNYSRGLYSKGKEEPGRLQSMGSQRTRHEQWDGVASLPSVALLHTSN